MPSIRRLDLKLEVGPAVNQIEDNPEFWDLHKTRTEAYGSPHDVSDIWVRYNDIANFGPDFNDKHVSVWYPCIDTLNYLLPLIAHVYEYVGGVELGGVLITRIRPGKEVKPHVDAGWHAGYYDKFAVQLQGNQDQCFHFEDSELRPEPGDVYTFDNSRLHWVTNDSQVDRMTLIICIKTQERV